MARVLSPKVKHMKIVLASNVLEHPGIASFLTAACRRWPASAVLVSGDLLNFFPEPGEDLEGSIFHEIYPDGLIVREMDRLVETRFAAPDQSRFIAPLRDMFLPTGPNVAKTRALARARYQRLFATLDGAMGNQRLYFIPGNMDYPRLADEAARQSRNLEMLDDDIVDLDGVRLAGLGGVPNTVHPFRGVVEISPYEMTEAEYGRRLNNLAGVDVLVTHVSPEECPMLRDFLEHTPLKLLICRAPFNFNRVSDFRGALEIQKVGSKHVIKVRPFDHPENHAFVIDLAPDRLAVLDVEVFRWEAAAVAPL